MIHEFLITTDHFQFYIEDEKSNVNTSIIWDKPSIHRRIAYEDTFIAVQTARYGGVVRVIVEVVDTNPIEQPEFWDLVIECSLSVPSGRLMISSPESSPSQVSYLVIPAETYRARICYGGQFSVTDELALEGDDFYRIILWTHPKTGPRVLWER
jgi:hypothetical protein